MLLEPGGRPIPTGGVTARDREAWSSDPGTGLHPCHDPTGGVTAGDDVTWSSNPWMDSSLYHVPTGGVTAGDGEAWSSNPGAARPFVTFALL